ncbi:MAG: diguanylate cyclase [Pseudomonadota bacterium]
MQSIYQKQQNDGFRFLRFKEPLEADYRAQLTRRSIPQLRFALVVAALGGFALPLMDFVMNGAAFSDDGIYLRPLLVQPIIGVIIAATFYRVCRPMLIPMAVVASLASATSILFLPTFAEIHGIASSLPAYVLITFFTYLFIGLPFRPALATSATAFLLYIGGAITEGLDANAIVYSAILLTVANVIAATGLYNLDYSRRLSFLREGELRFRASQDPLTGIANRGAFEDYFERAWNHCAREQIPIAVALIDIDHFKQYNDLYGHPAGDQCLQTIAPIIEDASQRPLDFAARYGGEEFVLLLPGCNTRRAKDIVDELRRNIIASVIEHGGSPTSALLTVSAGVASLMPCLEVDQRDELIRRADDALYNAKDDGRNRVAAAEESLADSRLAKVIRLADVRRQSNRTA